LLRGTGRTERFAPGSCGVIGGDAAVVEYHHKHPHVSRPLASLAVDGERIVLADLGDFSGTYLNDQRPTRLTSRRSNTGDSLGFSAPRLGLISAPS
jgi:pSer/pThr/pTyr-binding forkhead associated (FHA) protein